MVFRVPKIKTCCCFASLKTGSYIIAGLDVLSFFGVIYLASLNAHIGLYQYLFYDTVFLNIGVFSFMFIYGLVKKDHTLMFPWILLQSVFFILLLNFLLSDMVYLGLMDWRSDGIPAEILLVALTGYTYLVVYNYYRELKEPSTEELN